MTELLGKTLHSTNPIESIFSTVRDTEMNIKRFRGSAMRQRGLGTILMHCEKGFRKVKGYKDIEWALRMIEVFQQDLRMVA